MCIDSFSGLIMIQFCVVVLAIAVFLLILQRRLLVIIVYTQYTNIYNIALLYIIYYITRIEICFCCYLY